MVGWDRGTFNGFTWYNGGPCDSCGGMSSSKCIQTQYQPDYQQYTQSTCACEQQLGGLVGRLACCLLWHATCCCSATRA